MNVPSTAAPLAQTSTDSTDAARLAFGRNLTALLCGSWFLLTGWCWTYLANVFLSFPFALLGFFCWRSAHRIAPASRLHRASGALLLAGVAISLAALLLYK